MQSVVAVLVLIFFWFSWFRYVLSNNRKFVYKRFPNGCQRWSLVLRKARFEFSSIVLDDYWPRYAQVHALKSADGCILTKTRFGDPVPGFFIVVANNNHCLPMIKREEPPLYRNFKLVDLVTQHQDHPHSAGRSPGIHLFSNFSCKECLEQRARAFRDVGALLLVQTNA